MHAPKTEVILLHDGAELARVTLPHGEYVVGREPGAGIYADTPLLSRKHALLTMRDDALLIEDLGSSNGTFVDGQPVAGTALITLGQSIRLGDVTLELRRETHKIASSSAESGAGSQPPLPDEVRAEKRYVIGEEVARGGMGAILDVEQAAMKRRVAMKVMFEGAEPADVARFVHEAQITGQLDHPNIVPIHELGVDEQGRPFYTMKFVRGITLRKVLELLAARVEATVKKYPLPALLTIFQKVCDAVAFAHSKGVIHRDLKPENIMLGDFGSVLVMDWGLAKSVSGSAARVSGARSEHAFDSERETRNLKPETSLQTMHGTVMGTPQYMAPEQARGEIETMDERADIYALGAILYHMLALRPSVGGEDAWTIVTKVARGEVTPLEFSLQAAREENKQPKGRTPTRIPESLAAVVRKAMALDPALRYASVADLQADLTAYQSGFATSAEKAGLGRQLVLAVKRHKVAAAGMAAVLLVGTTLGAKAVIEGRRAEQALTALKATAPDLVRLAATDANAQNYAAAEKNIAAARALDPELRELYWQHTWNLIGMEDYPGAATAFREAIRRDPTRTDRVSAFRFLEQMATARTPEERSDAGVLNRLAGLLREAGATGPASVLLSKGGGNSAERLALVRERLGSLLKKEQFEVGASSSGYLIVSLKPGAVADLEILRGLPIDIIKISFGKITSLEPLRGMRLSGLDIGLSPVSDLSPLQGMALNSINLHATKVSDLRPLAGMPLTNFSGSTDSLVDLEPLRGAPLTQLIIYNSRVADLSPLAGAPLKNVQIFSTRVSNLQPLAGAPIEFLDMSNTPVADLTPLRGMPVATLKMNTLNQLTDLSPLRGLGIKQLEIDHFRAKGADFTPLLDLPKLETIACVNVPDALPVLRQHPTLKVIRYRFPDDRMPVDRPVAEFWQKYDAQQAAGKK